MRSVPSSRVRNSTQAARCAAPTGTLRKRRASASTASPVVRLPLATTRPLRSTRAIVRGIGFTTSTAFCQPR